MPEFMGRVPEITLVTADDWMDLFLDGVSVCGDHRISIYDLLHELGIPYTRKRIDPDCEDYNSYTGMQLSAIPESQIQSTTEFTESENKVFPPLIKLTINPPSNVTNEELQAIQDELNQVATDPLFRLSTGWSFAENVKMNSPETWVIYPHPPTGCFYSDGTPVPEHVIRAYADRVNQVDEQDLHMAAEMLAELDRQVS